MSKNNKIFRMCPKNNPNILIINPQIPSYCQSSMLIETYFISTFRIFDMLPVITSGDGKYSLYAFGTSDVTL